MKSRICPYLLAACEVVLALIALYFAYDLEQQFRGMRNCLLAIFVIGIVCYTHSIRSSMAPKRRRLIAILATLYSFGWNIGILMSRYDAVLEIEHTKVWVVASFAGAFILFRAMIVASSLIFDRALEADGSKPLHPLIGCVVVTAVSVFYLIAFYPGVTFFDGMRQLHSWFGDIPWTSHDPAFATAIIGICNSLGRAILDDNFGMFLYVLLITGFATFVFWRAFALIHNLNSPRAMGIGAMLYWSLLPSIHLYLVTMCKDTPFALCTMLLVVMLMDFGRRQHEGESLRKVDIAGILAVMLLMCNFRNDGIWVCIFTLIAALLFMKKHRTVAIGGIVVLLAFHIICGSFILPAAGIAKGSPREAISAPLQQIALVAREHPKSLPQQDIAYIDQLFGKTPEELGSLYDGHIADPVKNGFVSSPSREDWKALAKLWMDCCKLAPGTMIRGYLDSYYGYLYPDRSGDEIGFTSFAAGEKMSYNMNHHFMAWGEPLRKGVTWLVERFYQFPVIFWLYCPGFFTWMLAAGMMSVLSRGKVCDTVPFAPLLGVLIIALLSPVNGRIRYILSLIFCLPLVFAWAWHIASKRRSHK